MLDFLMGQRRHIGLIFVSAGTVLWTVYLYPRHKREGIAYIRSLDPKLKWMSYQLGERKWALWSGVAFIQLGTYLQW